LVFKRGISRIFAVAATPTSSRNLGREERFGYEGTEQSVSTEPRTHIWYDLNNLIVR
jgi:hypothetical protein